MHKIDTLEKAAREILEGRIDSAKELIQAEYPFKILTSVERNYTDKQKMVQFKKDGAVLIPKRTGLQHQCYIIPSRVIGHWNS